MFGTRRLWFASLLALGVVLPPLAARADAKVAVLDSVQAAVRLKLQIREAVISALDDLSITMVPMEDLTDEDAACAEAACAAAIAKRSGATHLLLVQGVANPAGYRLSFEVRDGETGRSLGTDGKDCELCAEDQVAPAVRVRIVKLWNRVAEEQADAAPAPAARPAPIVVPPAEKRPGVDTTTIPPWYQQTTPLMGLGLGVAGLVAAGLGVYYVTQDGKAIDSDKINGSPIWVRDTGKWGWSLVGVGAVAVVAGSAMVIWGRDDGTSVSVAVGPASLGLQGRF
jgi:hypothetical protein